MRVLVLHGYSGNATWCRRSDYCLQQLLKPLGITLHYVDGPIRLPDSPENPADRRCSWWNFEREGSWAECIAYLADVFDRDGPFDGIMGYSQGAACAGAIGAMLAAGAFPARLRFVVIACGFLSRDPAILSFFQPAKRRLANAEQQMTESTGTLPANPFQPLQGQIDLPSLHVIGEADRTTPPAMNMKLASAFRDPAIVRHPRGHTMLVDSERARLYLVFFARFASSQPALDIAGLAGKKLCQWCASWEIEAEQGASPEEADGRRYYCRKCWDAWSTGTRVDEGSSSEASVGADHPTWSFRSCYQLQVITDVLLTY